MEIFSDGATLVLAGSFDVRSTDVVRHALYEHIETHVDDDVVVDLSDVESIDTTALKVLAVATRSVQREGRHLLLRGCGPSVRRLIHLSRLRHFVQVERQAATA